MDDYETGSVSDSEYSESDEIDDSIENYKISEQTEDINDQDYPDIDDINFQYKLYKKREFYSDKYPKRPDISNYDEIKTYRDSICQGKNNLYAYQSLVSKYINPNTPYKGLLLFQGTGAGKTRAAIAAAENFKEQIKKYNTKIYVLVPGPLIKENWKKEIVAHIGEKIEKTQDMSKENYEALLKQQLVELTQGYRFYSYKGFYKRVLGEKIIDQNKSQDKNNENVKKKVVYRKNDDGDFERDLSLDRIYNLNNSLIIVDEAHNLTGNAYGEALQKIIDVSVNLKVLLLSATPMKNLAEDIVQLLNFIRPNDSKIMKEKIFTMDKIDKIELKEGGISYFKKMAQGYVSHVRGGDPLIYAIRNEVGEIPDSLLFTKLTRVPMLKFQQDHYNIISKTTDDTLDRKTGDISNIVIPGLSEDKKKIIQYSGREGIDRVKNQIKTDYELLNSKIKEFVISLLKEDKKYDKTIDENVSDMLYVTDDNKILSGSIFKERYLPYFSSKFYTALQNINRLFNKTEQNKKNSTDLLGAKTAFVYSNLVKVGIEIFQEILYQNGYLEYEEDSTNYQINETTRCYYCGLFKKEHSSSDDHRFGPATYITVTGGSDDVDVIPEEKQQILASVFSKYENKDGKYIKFVLGSKVMNEGISLRNVGEVHILDVYFNLGRIDQVIGRGIRNCSHYQLMNEDNKFPVVDVYKYAVTIPNGLSSEEELYRKAEQKYILIKKLERAMKEIAIDCPLNIEGNMFKEEIEKYKDCTPLDNKQSQSQTHDNNCPTVCDYQKCYYKCDDFKLNAEYYDPSRKMYKHIALDKLDYSTFSNKLAQTEVTYIRNIIIKMYQTSYVYTLESIISHVKENYSSELYDDFFVYRALDLLLPQTENDFNSFTNVIYDKYKRPGYLIFVNKYYIFQPFDEEETVGMYYRTHKPIKLDNNLSLYNYIKSTIQSLNMELVSTTNVLDKDAYDFNSVLHYYESRPEFKYVGIIDRENSTKKIKETANDIFKIREKRKKSDKKRGLGIQSFKGSVCSVSFDKAYLEKIAKSIDVDLSNKNNRTKLCDLIKNKLYNLEKYSTGENKMTYLIIPSNHPSIVFPLNLEDRVEYIKKLITDSAINENKIKFTISKNKNEYTLTVDGEYTMTPQIEKYMTSKNKFIVK